MHAEEQAVEDRKFDPSVALAIKDWVPKHLRSIPDAVVFFYGSGVQTYDLPVRMTPYTLAWTEKPRTTIVSIAPLWQRR